MRTDTNRAAPPVETDDTALGKPILLYEEAGVKALVGGLNKVYAALEKPPVDLITPCGTVCEAVRLQVCEDCECPWKHLADCSQWDTCLGRTVAEGACEGCEEAPDGR